MIIAAACLMLAGSWLTGCSAKADDSNQEKNTVAAVSESANNPYMPHLLTIQDPSAIGN